MMDFDSFKTDILKETFDLIDDIKSGRDLDFRKMKLFSKPIDSYFSSSFNDSPRRRNSNQRVSDLKNRFSSNPSFSSYKRTTSTETDEDNNVFKRTNIKRSESTYSTGSYETTDSNETLSEMSDSSFSPGSSKSRSSGGHVRTNSSSSDGSKVAELSKKLEDNFLKDERHSMPHELYSKCDRTLNDLDRPRSVPPNTGNPNLAKSWRDSDPNVKCFPSKFMESNDLSKYTQSRPISNGYDSDSRSTSTVTGTGSRLNSMSSFEFPSLSECDGGPRSPLTPTSPFSVRSPVDLSSPNLPNPPSYELTRNICRSEPAINSLQGDRKAWEERTGRIEDALKWLRSELGMLRAQDKVLLSSLSRCQDTIEDIKKQRTLNESDEEDVEDDEEGHWEDWEIAEFDRQCREKDLMNKNLRQPAGNKVVPSTKKDYPIRQDIQAVL